MHPLAFVFLASVLLLAFLCVHLSPFISFTSTCVRLCMFVSVLPLVHPVAYICIRLRTLASICVCTCVLLRLHLRPFGCLASALASVCLASAHASVSLASGLLLASALASVWLPCVPLAACVQLPLGACTCVRLRRHLRPFCCLRLHLRPVACCYGFACLGGAH